MADSGSGRSANEATGWKPAGSPAKLPVLGNPPVVDGSIFAWQLDPTPLPGGCGRLADTASGAQAGVAGETGVPPEDAAIRRIINPSNGVGEVTGDTDNAWSGSLTDPNSTCKMNWTGIGGEGFADGKFGKPLPRPAAVSTGRTPIGAKPFYLSLDKEALVVLVSLLLFPPLFALQRFARTTSRTTSPAASG